LLSGKQGDQKEQKMAHEIDAFVGRRIREERQRAGVTLIELSKIVGVRYQQLQKYEVAINRVSASRLWDIAVALEQPVATFFPTKEEALN
jgi:transcriptional regulator with XRE-family HTH domain